eukprot:7264268-Pyramimonas_sp.AAC.1
MARLKMCLDKCRRFSRKVLDLPGKGVGRANGCFEECAHPRGSGRILALIRVVAFVADVEICTRQVLEQQEASVGTALMGSSHTYVVPGAKAQKGGDVELTLRPEELEGLDEAAIQAKYEQHQQAEKEQNKQEDFSDMVNEIANKQKRKAQAKEKESKKKYKDFK